MDKKQVLRLTGRVVWAGLKSVGFGAAIVVVKRFAEQGLDGVKDLSHIDILELEKKS